MVKGFPALYVVPGISSVAVPAAGSLGPIAFKFPEARFVTGLLIVPESGDPADLAALSISIVDEDRNEIFSDGFVGTSARALALCGGLPLEMIGDFPHVQAFPLQRPVAAGDVWRFTLANASGAPVASELFILFRDAVTQ